MSFNVFLYLYSFVNVVSQISGSQFLTLWFKDAVKTDFYIDKTLLIEEFLVEKYQPNDYVMAPPNFGKTFNINMLKSFFEIEVDENGNEIMNKSETSNYELFKNRKIFKEKPEFFEKHFGQYPVISINYGLIRNFANFQELIDQAIGVIRDTFRQHIYLEKVEDLWTSSQSLRTFMGYIGMDQYTNVQNIQNGFVFLAKVLYKHFKRLPIVLIDEYDSYLNTMMLFNFEEFDSILSFFHFMHKPLFKFDPPVVRKVFCTGVLHALGAGTYRPTEMEPVNFFPFLHNHGYSSYYGITEHELTELLGKYTTDTKEMKSLKNDLHFYGGYKNAEKEEYVYSVLSVFSYLETKKAGEFAALRSYWARPIVYPLIIKMLYSYKVKRMLISLLQFPNVTSPDGNCFFKDDLFMLKNQTHFQNIDEKHFMFTVADMFHRYLLFHGYLTYTHKTRFTFHLRVPNKEIEYELACYLRESLVRQYDFDPQKIGNINNQIEMISKSTCKFHHFELLNICLYTLFDISKFHPAGTDFQDVMFSLLRYKHEWPIIPKDEDQPLRIVFKNKHNVTFIIKTILKEWSVISHSLMYRCSEDTLLSIDMMDRINKLPNMSEQVVYLGICLNTAKNTNGKISNALALSYYENFSSVYNPNNKTSIIL